MSKARTLADFISDGSEFADGTISVSEVSGAAPLASPTFTGNVTSETLKIVNGTSGELQLWGSIYNIQGGTNYGDLRFNAPRFRFYEDSVRTLELSGGNAYFFGTSIFNENGEDNDFRVESDSNAYAFFVDAGVNRVMVGDSAGSYDFNVRKSVAGGDVGIQLSNRDTSQTAGTRALIALQADVDNDGALEEFLHIRGGTSTGGFAEYVTRNGASMRFQGDAATSAVFNDSGADMDFRVESNNHTHALFVDAGNDYVGIDQSAPAYLLDVGNGSSSPSGGYTMRINSNGDTIFSLSRANTSLMSFRNDGAGYVAIASNNGAALMLGYSGNDAGAIANHLHFQSASTVVNEGGQNRDFRVESDSNSTALFVDAGYNSGKGAVLIGTNTTPSANSGYIAHAMLNNSEGVPVIQTGATWNFPPVTAAKQTQAGRWRFEGFVNAYHNGTNTNADSSYSQFICELPNGGPSGRSNLELFELGFNNGWASGFQMVEVFQSYYNNGGYKKYLFHSGYNPTFTLYENYGQTNISLSINTEGPFQKGTSTVPNSTVDSSYHRKTVRASYGSYYGGFVKLTIPTFWILTANGAETSDAYQIRLLNPA